MGETTTRRLTLCGSCGGEIPAGATSCVHCGVPLRRRTRPRGVRPLLMIQAIVAALLIAGGLGIVNVYTTGQIIPIGYKMMFVGFGWLVVLLIAMALVKR